MASSKLHIKYASTLSVGKDQPNFMYVCEDMFKDLDKTFPFSDFECDVLTKTNVAPMQLHPNSWAFMKVFSTLFHFLYITPSINKFLYFYWVKASGDGKVG